MKLVIAVLCLASGVFAGPAPELQSQSLQNDGSYKFSYDTGKESGSHSRVEERGPDGNVRGRYAYEDPTGDLRVVNYKAGNFGYFAKGAVGVAGAPDSQFPAEPVDSEEKGQEEKKEDTYDYDGQDAGNEKSEDVKEIKLPSLSADGPPDGFPIGFFDQGFPHGFRRLPEPAKDESDQEEKGNTADESDDNDKVEPKKSFVEYFHPIAPFPNFHPHTFTYPLHPAASSHQPVYVYSYQVPQSHGYYYYY